MIRNKIIKDINKWNVWDEDKLRPVWLSISLQSCHGMVKYKADKELDWTKFGDLQRDQEEWVREDAW